MKNKYIVMLIIGLITWVSVATLSCNKYDPYENYYDSTYKGV